MNITNRFPTRKMLMPVFAVIVTIVYSWTLYWFFYTVPAWMLYLRINEILAIYLYPLALNFVESLLFVLVLIGMCAALPKKWLYNEFIYRGTTLSMIVLGYLMANDLFLHWNKLKAFSTILTNWAPAFLLGALVLALVLEKIELFKKTVETLADRAIILTYIYIPLSMIAMIAIWIRLTF